METTRHCTATVYLVNDGATALHEHDRHDVRIPPGGRVQRDELPHEAGLREVREETGLAATLVGDTAPLPGPNGERLPRPRHHLLYDINTCEGAVGHQHVDVIYYATVSHRGIDPDDGEAPTDAWRWFTPTQLRESEISEDVVTLGTDAIRTTRADSSRGSATDG